MHKYLLILLAVLTSCTAIRESAKEHESHVPNTLKQQISLGIDLRDYQYIVIHHTEEYRGDLASVERYHRKKASWGCKYQFIIGNGTLTPMGHTEPSRRWIHGARGGHVSPYNSIYNEKGMLYSHMSRGRLPLQVSSRVTDKCSTGSHQIAT